MKQPNNKSHLIGIACAVLSAMCYGTNPFGALPLYQEGVNTATVLAHRFGLAVILLAVVMLARRESFKVTRQEFKVLFSLGILFAASSITYYQSFHFMDAGIASTILFVYPVMVAVIMASFFKERVTVVTVIAIVMSLVGILLLYKGGPGATISVVGIILCVLSSLAYAVYIVVVNQSSIRMSSFKVTFYAMLVCEITLVLYSFTSPELYLQFLPSPRAWFYACWLSVVPTILSLVFMTIAVHSVGATPTAILGALEPLTAVTIGVLVFGETLTPRLVVGILFILFAVMMVVLGRDLRLRTIAHAVSRLWHWK
ncbi:MAG: DMT family transporter [Muribaculaceae bacterium]|nr:DMT family transporter [Muribaculaceae bacterium]